MKRLSSDLRLQPENLHQWHLQFPFEQKYLWIDKIWQGPFLLFSSAPFLTNYVKLFNCRKIEDDCNCIVGTVSQIYVVINRVPTIIVDLWSLFLWGGRWCASPPIAFPPPPYRPASQFYIVLALSWHSTVTKPPNITLTSMSFEDWQ